MKTRVKLYPKEVRAAAADAAIKSLMRCGALVERDAKKSMHKGGASRLPRIGGGDTKTGSKYVTVREPSPPGSPPHVQRGTLRNSITHAYDKTLGTVIVGPTSIAWYGQIHEYGGRYGRALFPKRAFMAPALTRVRKRFPAMFRNLPLSKTTAGRKLNARRGKKG